MGIFFKIVDFFFARARKTEREAYDEAYDEEAKGSEIGLVVRFSASGCVTSKRGWCRLAIGSVGRLLRTRRILPPLSGTGGRGGALPRGGCRAS